MKTLKRFGKVTGTVTIPGGGWEKIAGKWYYFDKTGAMVSNATRKIGTRSYQFNASGACVNP